MMNKLALAMIVASMTALPMASAYAQTSTGSNNAAPATGQNSNSASGVKPTDPNGMPANCKQGDTACSKGDPNNSAAGGTMGTTGAAGAAGTDGTNATQGMGSSSPAKDGSANSPNCKAGDAACDTNGGRGGPTPAK